MKYDYLFEVWRPVVGYEGMYEASNFGRIKSIKYKTPRILHLYKSSFGYLRVALYKNNKQKRFFVHSLIANTFLPNPLNYRFINHKDENKINNFIYVNPDGSIDPEKSNLEWCTKAYNNNYGSRKERQKKTMLEKEIARKIKMLSLDGEYLKEFASVFKAIEYLKKRTYANIYSCANHKPHFNTAYGYKWEWA